MLEDVMERLCEGLLEAEELPDGVPVSEGVPVLDRVPVTLGLGELVASCVGDGVDVMEGVGACVWLPLERDEGVPVLVSVCVALRVNVPVDDVDRVAVPVRVANEVPVDEAVAVPEIACVFDGVLAGVAERVCELVGV